MTKNQASKARHAQIWKEIKEHEDNAKITHNYMIKKGWYLQEINSITRCVDYVVNGWAKKIELANDWCEDNCVGPHIVHDTNQYWFKLETDAFMFNMSHDIRLTSKTS